MNKAENKSITEQIIDSSIDAIIMIDNTGSIILWNKAAEKLFGFKKDEVLGQNPISLIFPENSRKSHYDRLNRFLETGEDPGLNRHSEFICIDNKGRQFPIELSLSSFRIQGRLNALGIIRDITNRKLVEEALRESEELFCTTFERAGVGMAVVELNGKLRATNTSMQGVLGYSNDELTKMSFLEFTFQDDIKPDWDQFQELISGRLNCYRMEKRFIRKDGKLIWGRMTASLVRKSDGEPHFCVGMLEDITERKKAEEALRESESKYKSVIDNVGIGIAIISRDMQILSLNRKMQEWFPDINISKKPICYSTYNNPPKDEICSYCPTVKTFKDGKVHESITETYTENGLKNYRVMSSPIRAKSGEVISAIEMVEDITQKVTDEKEQAKYDRLKSMGTLAGGIAHEINTPIQYIGDNLHFLEESYTDISELLEKYNNVIKKSQSEKFEEKQIGEIDCLRSDIDLAYLLDEIPNAIRQSLEGIERVAKIVRAMKEFAHPGSGKKELADLNKIIESTITIARNEWKYHAEVKVNLDPELPSVECYEDEIRQVFLNIIVNAAHAIGEKLGDNSEDKGTITVQTSRNRGWIEIIISDTGTGIPDEIKTRVFDPFFTTKETGKGTGQGLAIAHSIITEKHKGTISLKSEIGKGTTFKIRLPLKAEAVKKEENIEAENLIC